MTAMYRLLCAAALTGFLSLSGCGGSDDPKTAAAPAESIDVQLEGTWTSQVIINEEEAAKADAEAVAFIKSTKMQMTFTPDGKLELAGEANGRSRKDINDWTFIDQHENVLKIKTITQEGKEKDLEFFFNDADSFDMPINLETAQVGAMRFTRLR
jgi:hypothetical protein